MRRQELSSGLSWVPVLTWTEQPQGALESHAWTPQDAELMAISHSDDGEAVPPWQAGPCEQAKLTGMRIKRLMLRNVPEMKGKVDEAGPHSLDLVERFQKPSPIVQLTSREQTEPRKESLWKSSCAVSSVESSIQEQDVIKDLEMESYLGLSGQSTPRFFNSGAVEEYSFGDWRPHPSLLWACHLPLSHGETHTMHWSFRGMTSGSETVQVKYIARLLLLGSCLRI
ncbi:uncharacterized protein LOC116764502 isoform X1 [Phocoena sinus]|uniref:uncharacterized protein LOC116764502 isoform X1 n=1 Tax=Phocoena sinus TaxID=42100 RepID=UPI0013C47AC7|nr:uncharacterized protein LOC116764502 isoform X1 [Phocoena sinus]XP_032509068.1 uncharacterized protein LOC116764502 isoform X1 [Phocoena sinus]XP_032509069.1 uncharacterized protein LOC116764502 isoform X1 [Phocoena sinus]